nr:histone H1-like repetitive region-containing protein [Streptomyces sp. SID9727]
MASAQGSLPGALEQVVSETGTAADATQGVPQQRQDQAAGERPEQPVEKKTTTRKPAAKKTVAKKAPAKKAPAKKTSTRTAAAKKSVAQKAPAKRAAAKKPAAKKAATQPAQRTAAETKQPATGASASQASAAPAPLGKGPQMRSGLPLWQLTLEILRRTPGQPCMVREIHDQLARDYPGRKTSVQTVRNNLEILVKKSLAEKSRQQGNTMYTAPAPTNTDTADAIADRGPVPAPASPVPEVPAEV